MRSSFFALTLCCISLSASAQWQKIADFVGSDGAQGRGSESVTCVYFIDLPGPPRIGFVGSESELHKTIDGGKTWRSVWDSGWAFDRYYPSDICFKDSLTGWFSVYNAAGNTGDPCYRTTDGGDTWAVLSVPGAPFGASAIQYDKLFNRLLLSIYDTGKNGITRLLISNDLGNTWSRTSAWTGGFSFSDDSNGIAVAYPPYGDFDHGILRTFDGGLTWDSIRTPIACYQPLAIAGTSICFAADQAQATIRRSDDFGKTWHQIAQLPDVDSLGQQVGPYCTGVIRGDLLRLSIQTDSGIYISKDEGVTWIKDGGPMYLTNFSNERFFSEKGITVAGMTFSTGVIRGGGLWEEDWGTSRVKEEAPPPQAIGPLEIYDLLGRCVYRGVEEKKPVLQRGPYIEREGGVVKKVFVP